MSREKESAKILTNDMLSEGIYSMWLECRAAKTAKAGQFISVYMNDKSKLLPRPISICEIDRAGKLRIVYRVVGKGTSDLSAYKPGDSVEILGPIGNGYESAIADAQAVDNIPFTKDELTINDDTTALILGGGIGIPPMLGLAKELNCKKIIIAGYRNANELFLTEQLEAEGEFHLSTDDGSTGYYGTVLDLVKAKGIKADMIFACGPKPMLKGVKALGEEWKVPCYISMEERMACGVGACLGCVCKSNEVDSHSKVKNKRVCVDGPVFLSTEVEL